MTKEPNIWTPANKVPFLYVELKDQPSDEIRNYLEGLYNTIVIKDIVNRKKITDPNMLKSILKISV